MKKKLMLAVLVCLIAPVFMFGCDGGGSSSDDGDDGSNSGGNNTITGINIDSFNKEYRNKVTESKPSIWYYFEAKEDKEYEIIIDNKMENGNSSLGNIDVEAYKEGNTEKYQKLDFNYYYETPEFFVRPRGQKKVWVKVASVPTDVLEREFTIKVLEHLDRDICPAPGNTETKISHSTYTSVNISWQKNNKSYIDGVSIFRSEDNINFECIKTLDKYKTYYYDKEIMPGKIYYYKVQFYTDDEKYKHIKFMTSKANIEVPSDNFIPNAPVATDDLNNILISWPELSGVTSYKIYKADSLTSAYTFFGEYNNQSISCIDDNIILEKDYYYKISYVINGIETEQSGYSKGKARKHQKDDYENDDENYQIVSSRSGRPVIQEHTLSSSGDKDKFAIMYNGSTPFPLLTVSIKFYDIDLNGNDSFTVKVGGTITKISSNYTLEFEERKTDLTSGNYLGLSVEMNDYNDASIKYKVEIEIN